jgi:hypothetical protein
MKKNMAKPEAGEGLVIPEKQLSPAERIQKAKDAIEIGKNLGVALEIAGQLEVLTQYAEKNPETGEGKEILSAFEHYEKALGAFQWEEEQTKKGGDWRKREDKKRELEMVARGLSEFLKTMVPHILVRPEREQTEKKKV